MATKKKRPAVARKASNGMQTQLLNMLHQVWLAGLGAVARAQHGAPKLLEELVAEGAEVQTGTRAAAEKALRGAIGGVQETINARMTKMRGEATDAFENLDKIFRNRVHSALTQLGVPSAGEVESLSKRVDTLTSSIDKLARARTRTMRKNGSSHPARP